MKLTLPIEPIVSDSAPEAPALGPIQRPNAQYLLVCEAWSTTLADGRWRFTLETADGELILDADDQETGDINRLTLLAAVRGLESIEGAASVTLVSNNRYLIRSLSDALPKWRANNFVWDHFGRHVDVQHADLWRRIDHALSIHRVEACLVSTCLVSRGTPPAARTLEEQMEQKLDAAENLIQRVDPAHGDRSGGGVPAPKSKSIASEGTSPEDRLRQWLLSNSGARTNTRRFTPEDFLETA